MCVWEGERAHQAESLMITPSLGTHSACMCTHSAFSTSTNEHTRIVRLEENPSHALLKHNPHHQVVCAAPNEKNRYTALKYSVPRASILEAETLHGKNIFFLKEKKEKEE